MTREEAHRILSNGLVNAPSEHEWCMAFEVAIQALSQEPCDDAISRDAVNTLVDELARAISDERCHIPQRGRDTGHIMHDILDLPSVTQKSGWIPVSERLPEFDVPVLVYQTYYKGNAITIGRYHSDEKQGGYKYWQWIMYDSWFSYGIDHFGIICPNSDFVEAWMPLPEPYEPQERSDKE